MVGYNAYLFFVSSRTLKGGFTLIKVENLVKRYGDNYAVNDISFTVEKGKIYGFLGPNGAGKSTAMNIITGYTAATSGRVSINGHDTLEEPDQARRCIGYLPEQPPLYLEMTVFEYLMFAASIKGVAKADRKAEVEKVMEKTSVTHMRDRLINHLSKGYRQRVGLSQALLGNPEVIILDEPSVGLDPGQIIEMRELIRSLAGNHTVILSSHILSEVSAVCDKVLILSKGRLIAQDTPENLSKIIADYVMAEMTLIAEPQKVLEVLKPLEGVSYAILPVPDSDRVKVTIRGNKDVDVQTIVSVALAKAQIPVIAINTLAASLEDIFLSLTTGKLLKKQANSASEGGKSK